MPICYKFKGPLANGKVKGDLEILLLVKFVSPENPTSFGPYSLSRTFHIHLKNVAGLVYSQNLSLGSVGFLSGCGFLHFFRVCAEPSLLVSVELWASTWFLMRKVSPQNALIFTLFA